MSEDRPNADRPGQACLAPCIGAIVASESYKPGEPATDGFARRHDIGGHCPSGKEAAVSPALRAGAGCDRARCGCRSFCARVRRSTQAARRCLHQAGEDDHRAGDLRHRGDRDCRNARSEGSGQRGGQGLRLFPHLLDPRAGHRPRRRQCRAPGRGAEHRSRHARYRRGCRLCRQGRGNHHHRLPARHHPRHPVQLGHRRSDPAGAAGGNPRRRRDRRDPSGERPRHRRARLVRGGGVQAGAHADEACADRGLRGDGLHHRRVRDRQPCQPRGAGRDVLPHLAAVRAGGAGAGRMVQRLLDLRADPLPA